MKEYSNCTISKGIKIILRLSLALVFFSVPTLQQCNSNDIKPFPRVIGVPSIYSTNSNQLDTN